jgi:RecA/RadA recombinase
MGRSAVVRPSGVLPRPSTSFVGRETELVQARGLLAGMRLLTLAGPGGSGKTRLAIELASRTQADPPRGALRVVGRGA